MSSKYDIELESAPAKKKGKKFECDIKRGEAGSTCDIRIKVIVTNNLDSITDALNELEGVYLLVRRDMMDCGDDERRKTLPYVRD